MHICFLTSEYPPLPSGGIGTSIRNLGQMLVKKGYRVSVIGWGKPFAYDDCGVSVRFFASTNTPKMGWLFNRVTIAREINRMILDEELDIVEAPDWCGLSAGIKPTCPVVIRCHGSDTYFGSLLGYTPRLSIRIAESLAIRSADAVTAVSQFTAQKTGALFRLKQNIHVIPNGIDISLFQHGQTQHEPDTILYFGTLIRKKGALDLCKIFNKVVAKHPNTKLWLIGRDAADKQTASPSTWKLMQAALTPEALSQTQYFGPMPYERLQSYIHQATLCVFPSYAEALPLSWMEAMACGKPLVASNIGWANEIVDDNINGFLVAPSEHDEYAEKILFLMENEHRCLQFGLEARRKIEASFSSDVTAKMNISWYTEVLERSSRSNR